MGGVSPIEIGAVWLVPPVDSSMEGLVVTNSVERPCIIIVIIIMITRNGGEDEDY